MEIQFPDPESIRFKYDSANQHDRDAWLNFAREIVRLPKEPLDWCAVQSRVIGLKFILAHPDARDAVVALSFFPVRKSGRLVKRDEVVKMINSIISV